jgi:cell division protein FtsB
MKIILVDEEAHQYMDMRDDIAEYKERIAELSEEIKSLNKDIYDLQLKYKFSDLLTNEHTEAYNTAMEVLRTHAYPTDTTREEHTSVRWSIRDKEMLTNRIFMTGKYYGIDRTFDMIRALFPERTEASVTAMIYHLGGTIKKGIVHPRIQPKQKENNA